MDKLSTIEANLSPGGVVVRVYVDKELMAERKLLDGEEAMVVGNMDRDQAMKQAKHTVEILSWDGDSGAARTIAQLLRTKAVLVVKGVPQEVDAWFTNGLWMSPEFQAAAARERADA
jgi:hypothetical protein